MVKSQSNATAQFSNNYWDERLFNMNTNFSYNHWTKTLCECEFTKFLLWLLFIDDKLIINIIINFDTRPELENPTRIRTHLRSQHQIFGGCLDFCMKNHQHIVQMTGSNHECFVLFQCNVWPRWFWDQFNQITSKIMIFQTFLFFTMAYIFSRRLRKNKKNKTI